MQETTQELAKNPLTAKSLFNRDDVKQKFQELLGKRASSFITSVLQIVASNALLKNADPTSIYQAAATAAAMDLPLQQNLGFAYIVPYNQKKQDKQGNWHTIPVAQFQMGYKGFIQLAQRTGLFKTIGYTAVLDGQLKGGDNLFGWDFDLQLKSPDAQIVGYAAYFKLINGFEKTYYLTKEEISKHGKKYSQTYKKGIGLWETDFDQMALKTVLKLLLSKFAPLSIDMQLSKAIIADQGVIGNSDTMEVEYADAVEIEDKEAERTETMILNAESVEELLSYKEHITEAQQALYDGKLAELKKEKN